MTRFIRRELVQPSYLVGVPTQQWTDEEKAAGRCGRKQPIEPLDSAVNLFAIAVTAVGQGALTEADIRASIGLQDAIDPARCGEPSVPLGEYMALPDDAHTYLIKKLDAQNWFSLESREILEMVQTWRDASNVRPLSLKALTSPKRRKIR